ncbi:MAG TPA: TM2 domain-containing protein [Pyrinomonadaceae bacterium]|nr:TM2 domain-containing protein [Pyrinomonadaceae bacterium]
MSRFCTKCGAANDDTAQYCTTCQTPLTPVAAGYQPMQSVNPGQNQMVDWKALGADKKLVAGLLGILVGGFGVHKFVLGYTTEGIIQIVITFLTCGIGSIVGLVEGIIYLTKSDEEFVRTYIQGRKGWF